MNFIEMVNAIEENIQKNILPLFNQQAMLTKLATIKSQAVLKETARRELIKFCAELLVMIKQLLSITANATQNQMIQTLNKTKIKLQSHPSVEAPFTKVKIDQYIHLAEIKNTYYQTYLLNTDNLAKINALNAWLQQAMQPLTTATFDYAPPLNRGPALGTPAEELNLLQKDKENVFAALAQVENAIKVFDIKIMELYECPISQVYNTLPHIFLTTSSLSASLINQLQNTHVQLQGTFANREVIFVMTKPDDKPRIRTDILINYIYGLRYIKQFALKKAATQGVLLPKVDQERNSILKKFNISIKEAFSNFKALTGELRIGHVLKTDTSTIRLNLIEEPQSSTVNTAVATTSAELPKIDVFVIGKNIEKAELPKINSIKYTVINDDKLLLAEAQLAYRILEIKMLLGNVLQTFHNTPKHLIISPEILLKSELDRYIDSITHDKVELDNLFNEVIENATFKNNPFAFERNHEFLAIQRLITEISATLPALLNEIRQIDSAKLESLAAMKPKITGLQKSLYNVTQTLIKFKNCYPNYLYLGQELVKNYNTIESKLPKLEKKLAYIESLYAELASQAAFHKLAEPLADIMRLITSLKDILAEAKEFFATCDLPTDSNDFDKTRALIYTLKDHIHQFEDKASQAMDIITKQKLLLKNAEITKQNKSGAGTHPNRFMTPANSSSASSSSTSEEKHHSQCQRRM